MEGGTETQRELFWKQLFSRLDASDARGAKLEDKVDAVQTTMAELLVKEGNNEQAIQKLQASEKKLTWGVIAVVVMLMVNFASVVVTG